MNIRAPAILVASRAHGETATIARLLTEEYGLVAGYVAGGRGRQLRPVMIPGNRVAMELRAKSDSQLPFAKLELEESRGPWMTEPLPAAAVTWACALTASVLPERNPYPSLYQALDGLLTAICHAPSARGWLAAMVAYEAMLLRELGYGGAKPDMAGDLDAHIEAFRALHRPIARYLLADTKGDVMAARVALGERLVRMVE
ncbi:DNA repair protein RecO [Erythrobacter rubeus]|uniref:DNA repair protein RecO n=1 Tax=Erythrobacter rubeus TaxID=2760803 RepID=A0ABR8KTD0_9SPHN|nr:DNA repair protein RecO C-terminal domain-containing protein [Erythrobacter rubeus]MBD2841396.1 recombination protein O N-terminal domain-containing protein [Erythrobacter rubeus]